MPEETLINIMRDFENKHNSRMEKIEINQAVMTEKIGNVECGMKSIEAKLDKFIDGADTRYAPIISWIVIKYVIGVIGGIIISTLMYTIIIK